MPRLHDHDTTRYPADITFPGMRPQPWSSFDYRLPPARIRTDEMIDEPTGPRTGWQVTAAVLRGATFGASAVVLAVGALLLVCVLLAEMLFLFGGCLGFIFAWAVIVLVCHPMTQLSFLAVLGAATVAGGLCGLFFGGGGARRTIEQRTDGSANRAGACALWRYTRLRERRRA